MYIEEFLMQGGWSKDALRLFDGRRVPRGVVDETLPNSAKQTITSCCNTHDTTPHNTPTMSQPLALTAGLKKSAKRISKPLPSWLRRAREQQARWRVPDVPFPVGQKQVFL